MQKTSGEIEKEFIDGLKSSTGKTLSEWMKEIDSVGLQSRNDRVKWLKEQNGFGHMNANLLLGIHANGGKPVYASSDTLVENQFAKAPEMRGLFDSIVDFTKKHFPEMSVVPKKTYISIVEKREFCALNIKPKEIRLGLDLGDMPFDARVEKAKLTGPMPRISHMTVITDASQLDAGLAGLMKTSHARCH